MRPEERFERALGLADGSCLHVSGRTAPVGATEPEVPCCDGVAYRDGGYCTCWEPVYDGKQAEPDLTTEPTTRDKCCHDCAYHQGSPEREEDKDWLLGLAARDRVFWCHQGHRRVVEWRHPDGRVVPAEPGDYKPPEVDGVPHLLDGRAGERCAGWMASCSS